MPLDVRGSLAAAQLAFWTVMAIPNAIFIVQYGLRQDAGYIFLLVFSLSRVAQGALVIAGEIAPNPDPNLFTAAYIIYESALPLLFLAAMGFLGLAGQHSYSDYRHITRVFRAFGLVPIVGIVLHVAGGVLSAIPGSSDAAHDPNGSTANTALILRRVAAGIDVFTWLSLGGFSMMALGWRYEMRRYRRKFLYAIIVGILFLAVRAAYSILETWSSSDLYGINPSGNAILAKFQPITGDWIMYLVLGLGMEYLAAIAFITGALFARHQRRNRY